MLTIQNILDHDSLSTLVAKLNANFQAMALSNGGPQGVRGEQGIPGFPGRQGATGPQGPVGATGPTSGIIPFSVHNLVPSSYIVPTGTGSGFGAPNTYNPESYTFLTSPLGPNPWGPNGFPIGNQLYFDNNELGWWKYLTQPDPDPSIDTINGVASITYVESPFYDSGSGGSYTGPDWYFYPLNLAAIINQTQAVWSADKSNYLGRLPGSAYASPATVPTLPGTQSPYEIQNARMNSKFGSVWVSSFDGDGTTPPFSGGNNTVNATGYNYYWDYATSPRLSAGIDRSLFKMSIDGPLYFDMMKARGFRDIDFGLPVIGVPYLVNSSSEPIPNVTGFTITAGNAGAHQNYFPQPIYNVTIDAYSPIVFYGNRSVPSLSSSDSTTLGYLQFAATSIGTPSPKIHLFTTRQNDEFFDPTVVSPATPIAKPLTASANVGEALWDVRRFITSNQYLNMFPQDSANFTSVVDIPAAAAPFDTRATGNQRDAWNAPNKWQVFQGYHSVFTGQKVIENAVAGNQAAITGPTGPDTWMYEDRQSWYGTSIFEAKPDLLSNDPYREMVRSAGLMVDAKNYITTVPSVTSYQDRVYIYTSNMTSPTGTPLLASYSNPSSANNTLLSLPVAYYSATRNIGFGTVTNDKAGMFEPSAKLQVHSDWRNEDYEGFGLNTNYTGTINAGTYNSINKAYLTYTDYVPKRRMKSAAFTIERNSPAAIWEDGSLGVFDGTQYEVPPNTFSDWYTRGVFNDILLGAVAPMDKEPNNGGANQDFAATYLRPNAGIRYESYNYDATTQYIVNAKPARNYGWNYRGALRLGSSPYFSGTNYTAPTTDEIGSDANLQNLEYQLTIAPLSFSDSTSAAAKYEMVSGIGVHNLYPRTRAHFYGKNAYQEFRFDEGYSPGSENPGGAVSTPVVADWGALASNNQITIDYIGDSYWYNASMYDYPYDYTVTPTSVSMTPYSPNARNYPTKEIGAINKTKNTYHPTNNYAVLTATSGVISGFASPHGGIDNALWAVDKYIGFNVFRDLLAKGDEKGEAATATANTPAGSVSNDKYASSWRIGTEGTNGTKNDPSTSRSASNGGSLIMTDSVGRMGFSFLSAYRDGGVNYRKWEQQNIGTREIVDNIKIVFDEKGNIGIGNAPGVDANAYPSTHWNSTTGYINYLPNAASNVADPTVNNPLDYATLASGSAWSIAPGDNYGLGVPAGIYGGYDVAGINTKATLAESIRFEVAGEKATTRVGHHPELRGYGYPGWSSDAVTGLPITAAATGATITITDNATADYALRYCGITAGAAVVAWASAIHTFKFDNLGRLLTYTVGFTASAYANNQNLLVNFPTFKMPHPRDFAEGGPFGGSPAFPFAAGYPWTTGMSMTRTLNAANVPIPNTLWIPISAAAATLSTLVFSTTGFIASASVAYEELQESVMRLNNFTLGEGYQLLRNGGDVQGLTSVIDEAKAATIDIYTSRISSPKILLTFGAPDTASADAAGLDSSEINALTADGLMPLMKVTTVIESAQTDAAQRTYTIPKADNTGGSFMVITDHLGVKEKDTPGLVPLPKTPTGGLENLILDKVVALEVVRTGVINNPQSTTIGFVPSSFNTTKGVWDSPPPSYELLPIHYVKNYTITNLSDAPDAGNLKCIQTLVDPIDQVNTTSIADPSFRVAWEYGSNSIRDLDTYWRLDTGTFASPFAVNGINPAEKKSEVRYKRLNENFVLVDFNLNLEALLVTYVGTISAAVQNPTSIGALKNFLGDGNGGNLDQSEGLTHYIHSPYAPGHLVSGVEIFAFSSYVQVPNVRLWVGIDARWVQYVRVIYNSQQDTVTSGLDDPEYFEKLYGGGANFSNWSNYRAWNAGTAVVGSEVGTAWYLNSEYTTGAPGGLNQSDDYGGFGNNGFNVGGSGLGFAPPRDGSPYSVWTKTIEGNAKSANAGMLRYFNGRINDWYNSRWSQENPRNPFPNSGYIGDIYYSMTDTFDISNLRNSYDHSYPFDFAAPGLVPGVGSGAGSFQNNESLPGGKISYPGARQNEMGPAGPSTNGYWKNNSWVGQYAYKMYWKWFQPVAIANLNLSLGTYYVYTQHTKTFDSIISRCFGDDAWVRNGSMQWKITPLPGGQGEIAAVGSDRVYSGDCTTFAIEVMFDKPIFVSGRTLTPHSSVSHHRTLAIDGVRAPNATAGIPEFQHNVNQIAFFTGHKGEAGWAAGSNPTAYTTISPLSDMTLRGQSIVKYEKVSYALTKDY